MVQTGVGSLDDFLERMDIVFQDFTDIGALVAQLEQAFGTPGMPTLAQLDAAVIRLQIQRQTAFALGFRFDRFTRRGEQVSQLRDRFGRFITSGARNISAFLQRQGI